MSRITRKLENPKPNGATTLVAKQRAKSRSVHYRIAQGKEYESELETYIRERGFRLEGCGVEKQFRELLTQLRRLQDPTTNELRFAPDYICIMPGLMYSFYIEAKTELSSTHTGNIAFDLEECRHQVRKAYTGVKILVVAASDDPETQFVGAWIEDLERWIVKKFTNPRELKRNNGSGKPYITISKDGMRPLHLLLEEIKEQVI